MDPSLLYLFNFLSYTYQIFARISALHPEKFLRPCRLVLD